MLNCPTDDCNNVVLFIGLLDKFVEIKNIIIFFLFLPTGKNGRPENVFRDTGTPGQKPVMTVPVFRDEWQPYFIRLDIAARTEMSKRWRNRVGRNSCRFQSLNSRLALYVISGPFDAMTSVVAADAGRRPMTGGKQKSFGACDGRAGRAVLRLLFINYKRYAWARGNAPTNAR